MSGIIHVYFINNKAKNTGQPAWSRLAKLILYAMSPPLVIGGILTILFYKYGYILGFLR